MADRIVSRPATDKYREEYDRIFKKSNGHLQETSSGDDQRPGVSKTGPQYGVIQVYNWRGPSSQSQLSKPGSEAVGTSKSVETGGVDSDVRGPITEDGSEPSSK